MKTANILMSQIEAQQIIALNEMACRTVVPIEQLQEMCSIALHIKQKLNLAFQSEEKKEVRFDESEKGSHE